MNFKYRHTKTIVSVLIILSCTSLYAIMTQQFELLYMSILMMGVAAAPIFIKETYDVHLPIVLVLFSVFFILVTLVFGELHDFYDKYTYFDNLLHFFSAVVFGIFGFLFYFFVL